jgi:M6 family metalloprotease-like protein
MPPLSTVRPNLPLLLALALALVCTAAAANAAGSSRGQHFTGTFVLRHTDAFRSRGGTYAQLLKLDSGRLLNLAFRGGAVAGVDAGTRISVRGAKRGNRVVVADGGVQSLGGTQAAAMTVVGTKKLLVLLVNFANDRTEPLTTTQVADAIFGSSNSIAAYYAEQTFGRVTIGGDVRGWFHLTANDSTCAYTSWGTEADGLAKSAGIDLSAYTNVMYVFPKATSCGWAGASYMPGTRSWINGPTSQGNAPKKTIAHEFGHNLGVHHANGLSCADNGVRVTLSSTCTSVEYADSFDVMGTELQSVVRHMNAWHKLQLGVLPSSNVQTVTSSGTYTVAPMEPTAATVQLLKVPRGSSGTSLWLDFRQRYGSFDNYSATSNVVTGVLVHLGPDTSQVVQSQLLDMTPATSAWTDSALVAGMTFVDQQYGITLTTSSVSSAGATLRVTLAAVAPPPPPPPADTSPPSQPAGITASAQDANHIALAWGPSTDDVGVSGYRVYRDSALIATVASPGYTDSGLLAGTSYSYDVVAFDAAGNVSAAASASATTPAVDTTPPTAPTNLKATVAKGKKVAVTWAASTDNVGLKGYQLYRNGSLVATTTGTSYTDAVPGKASSVSYYVVAFDAAGNFSVASTPLGVAL